MLYLCDNFSLPRPLCSRVRPNVQLNAIGSRLWSPAWTDLVSPVHCRPVAARQTSSSHATRVCRQHPDLWTLSAVRRWRSCSVGCCLHQRGFCPDEGKSTAAESCQDRGPLVHLISTSTVGPDRICSSVMFWCHRLPLLGTLVFTLTLMSP